MSNFIRRWLTSCFFSLLMVACLGVILRYKIAFSLPFIDQKHLLHSHSHFAFSGWVTQTLIVLMVHYLGTKSGESVYKRYNWLLYANLFTAYGMLVSFIIQGYAFFSILFSTLSIFVAYIFAIFYWKDLGRFAERRISHSWFKASLVFSVISSLGAFSLAIMMANKMVVQNWYLGAIYFFLHFQYNGWFFFAGMGLLVSKLEIAGTDFKKQQRIFQLFCFACVPAYLLSVLWFPFPAFVYWIIVAAVVAQLAGWTLMVKLLQKNLDFMRQHFSVNGRILLLLAAIAYTIKLLLQTGSVHPALSQLSYGFRPIIIGYLHLVLLAVTSIFLIGYIVSFQLVIVTKRMLAGIYVFVSGIIINELLLMVQGVGGLGYVSIPYIDVMLLAAALILMTGIGLVFTACLKTSSKAQKETVIAMAS